MKLLFFFLESPKRPLKSRWEMLKFKFSHDQDITRFFEFCHLTFLAKVQSVWSVYGTSYLYHTSIHYSTSTALYSFTFFTWIFIKTIQITTKIVLRRHLPLCLMLLHCASIIFFFPTIVSMQCFQWTHDWSSSRCYQNITKQSKLLKEWVYVYSKKKSGCKQWWKIRTSLQQY